ncbi:MAG: FAD-dependent oxidoreductase [Candidatus Eisenbacteria sp.]|nr:FAD-dependent oxidoreductase [Candidatus Eisenbacteria bacterium]
MLQRSDNSESEYPAAETAGEEQVSGDGETGKSPEEPRAALVIGGGIAGIQAAIDLADSNIRVCLVEKSPSLGGRMAQLDKTFPTMDCSI